MVLSRLALAKAAVHLAALTPMAILAWQVVDVARTGSNALGADPVAEIEHRLGLWALRLLMVALAVTPLRQLTGQPVLIRFRRMLGLYAFVYATLHFGAYLVLDLRGYWEIILEDIARRRTGRPLTCTECASRSSVIQTPRRSTHSCTGADAPASATIASPRRASPCTPAASARSAWS